jgi:hypothetical protein
MMSEPIIATTFTDPGINSIRAQVAGNSDLVPYLLLPVKIETRFMRVDRPIVKPNKFGEILTDIANLNAYSNFDPLTIPVHEVTGRYKKVAVMAEAIAAKVNELDTLDGASKKTLAAAIKTFLLQNQSLGAAAGKLKNIDAAQIVQLRSYRNAADSRFFTALTVLAALQPATPASDTFLQPLQAIVKALTSIASTDLSSNARLEKRQSFSFIEEQQALVLARI